MRNSVLMATLILLVAALTVATLAVPIGVVLPTGWVLNATLAPTVATGTMPQGMAQSPDGKMMAVIESGFPAATLGLYSIPGLARLATIPLPGAFGRPVWRDERHVLVAGANADALLDVDVASKTVATIAFPKDSYPALICVAPNSDIYAVASYGDDAVRIGRLSDIGTQRAIPIGGHPGGIAFGADSSRLFVTFQPKDELLAIDRASLAIQHYPAGRHPSAVAFANGKIYVAETDADAVGVYGSTTMRRIAEINVGAYSTRGGPIGVSPNAISLSSDRVYVSLGAANSVAVIRDDRLIGRAAAGWYPTDVAAVGNQLYVLNAKGEGSRPNPGYRAGHDEQYIGTIEYGSLRAYPIPDDSALSGNSIGAQGWDRVVGGSVVRPGGPIRHIIFVLKENRSYDQILGDVAAGNGDKSLVWYGENVTPNEHAIAARFGLFDNAYAGGEVSAVGHFWADAAFANDYSERTWGPSYGGRYNIDDSSAGDDLRLPAAGYLWDSARRAHVSFRDYGELIGRETPTGPLLARSPSLDGHFDPAYVGWDLDYSDLDRVKEWRREFTQQVRDGTLPQLEFVFLPNDHTYGSKIGKLTPVSYVATNDYAVGQMADTLSHSKVWRSSAMFIIEDDAQDGPDHVSDQRVPLFVVSPYASGGVHSQHYSTLSVLRTIEIMLGLRPLSLYDARAVPMYEAFGHAVKQPYNVIPPKVDITKTNAKTAYGAAQSARANFERPDAILPETLNDILAHNH